MNAAISVINIELITFESKSNGDFKEIIIYLKCGQEVIIKDLNEATRFMTVLNGVSNDLGIGVTHTEFHQGPPNNNNNNN